jgi:hypothetical protein
LPGQALRCFAFADRENRHGDIIIWSRTSSIWTVLLYVLRGGRLHSESSSTSLTRLPVHVVPPLLLLAVIFVLHLNLSKKRVRDRMQKFTSTMRMKCTNDEDEEGA